MNLLQYRFSPDAFKEASYIGREVEAFLRSVGDLDLVAVKSRNGETVRESAIFSDIACTIAQSFEESYKLENIDEEKWVSIKSLQSCRFLVFEDDGLLRICYSSTDTAILFSKLAHDRSDESHLLIETDLFDFL